jgi:hypothetical protein
MKKFILCVIVFCFFISCKDNTVEGCKEEINEAGLPQWLDDKIEELKKDDYTAQIDKLHYSWGTAVFINPCTECADFYTYIYDNCGNQVCRSGGFIGENNCPAIYQQESQKSLIWKE